MLTSVTVSVESGVGTSTRYQSVSLMLISALVNTVLLLIGCALPRALLTIVTGKLTLRLLLTLKAVAVAT